MENGPEVVNEKRLLIDGYIYVRSGRPKGRTTQWECNRLWKKECPARATTVTAPSGPVTVIKGLKKLDQNYHIKKNKLLNSNYSGPNESEHSHPPNREEADAEKRKLNLKRKAETHADRPPSALVRDELEGASAGTLALMPERENLKQSIRRARNKNVEKTPTSLQDLEEIPEKYQTMVNGSQFLIYDSRDHDQPKEERVLVFSTERNLELLSESAMWFLDGTFKVKLQVFTNT